MTKYNIDNIYGAGIVAYNVALALNEIEGPAIRRFFVSNKGDCNGFGGIFAEYIDDVCIDNSEQILIATPTQYHDEIEASLICKGILKENIVRLEPCIEYSILGEYFKKKYDFKLLNDFDIRNGLNQNVAGDRLSVFMAEHIKDQRLKSIYNTPNWMQKIQAGAALTSKKITDITDDFPGGISDRNNNYSELSVTYWAWKNCKSEYIGICHYRRVYGLKDDEVNAILDAGIDLILTLPYMCKASATEQYFRYVSKDDYNVFLDCFKLAYGKSELYEAYLNALNKEYVYNYNMLIAKSNVFNEYCEFIFTVLFEMERYYEKRGIIRSDRYLGYFGEILSSIFFIVKQEEFNVVHVPRIWLA